MYLLFVRPKQGEFAEPDVERRASQRAYTTISNIVAKHRASEPHPPSSCSTTITSMAPLSVAGLIEFHVLDTGPLKLRTYCIPGGRRGNFTNQCPVSSRKMNESRQDQNGSVRKIYGCRTHFAEEPDEDSRLSCDTHRGHVQSTCAHCVARAKGTKRRTRRAQKRQNERTALQTNDRGTWVGTVKRQQCWAHLVPSQHSTASLGPLSPITCIAD